MRGKTQAERIFEPVGREGEVAAADRTQLVRWHDALQDYRERRFNRANAAFEALANLRGYERLVSIHLGYVRTLLANPPNDDWDAAFTLYDK